MSVSVPPPCNAPVQNHGECGPLCSSAARARYGRPVRRAARPQQFVPGLGVRREQLILEIARLQAHAPGEVTHALRLRHVARQRFLAGESTQRSLAGADRVDDLLDILDPRLIRSTEPDGIDRGVGHHVGDRPVCFRFADIQFPRQRCSTLGTFPRRTPDTEDISITDSAKRLNMEARVEPAADEADSEPCTHATKLTRITDSSLRGIRASGRRSPPERW